MFVAGQKTTSVWVWSLASVSYIVPDYAYYDFILNIIFSRSTDLFKAKKGPLGHF